MLELGVEFGWDVPSPYRGLPFLIAPVPRVSRPLLPASSAIATINFVLMALNRVNQIQINSTTPGHSSLWAFAWIHERNSLIQVDLRASGWDSLDIQRRFLLTFIPDNLQLLMVFASQASRRLQIQIRYGFKLNVQDRIQTSSVSQHLLLIAHFLPRISNTPPRQTSSRRSWIAQAVVLLIFWLVDCPPHTLGDFARDLDNRLQISGSADILACNVHCTVVSHSFSSI